MNAVDLEFIDGVEQNAHHIRETHDEVMPVVIVRYTTGKSDIFALPFRDHHEQRVSYDRLIRELRAKDPVEIAVAVNDVYTATVKEGTPRAEVIPPRHNPQRQEAIQIWACKPDGDGQCRTSVYTRDGKKIVWGTRTVSKPTEPFTCHNLRWVSGRGFDW